MGKIKQALTEQSSKKCAFIKIYEDLDEEDREAISEAIADDVSSYGIANALLSGGYKIAHSSVSQHINERCRCKGQNI